MQFHVNGYVSGDPGDLSRLEENKPLQASPVIPSEIDVLIIGSGPAGLALAAQLSQFPTITTRLIEQKPERLTVGQADGLQCRTIEMFEAYGFSEKVLKEAYWVNETTFWKPDERDRATIVRSGRIRDTEEGLSEFPHVILNQARIHDFFLDVMRKSPQALEPDFSRKLVDLKSSAAQNGVGVDGKEALQSSEYPVNVTLENLHAEGESRFQTVRARYVVGCDGARSNVRKALDLSLTGDSANQAWGVMDVLAVSDFPDYRTKAAIHSADHGSILIIPREGGYMVRFYIELDKLSADERVSSRNIKSDHLVAAAQRILHPYTLDVKQVAWWSVYEIGQRLCNRFDDVPEDEKSARIPNVFIAGDACHTHSPKAGQGMNVSMQDGFNLAWKLASVIRGHSSPKILHTYSAERQAVAKELIDFDREFAKMFSAKPKDTSSQQEQGNDGEGVDPAEFQRYFQRQGRFTAGMGTRYLPSLITGSSKHQSLATGFEVGTRFHSAAVIRLSDAKPLHLGHVIKADGRWRIFLFAGKEDPSMASSGISRLCQLLSESPKSPLRRYTPHGADPDSVFDIRAVFQQPHVELQLDALPSLLWPRKGKWGLRDYEKMFCAESVDGKQDIFAARGVDRENGCMVVVRPDQYVSHVLPIDGFEELVGFFDEFMLPS